MEAIKILKNKNSGRPVDRVERALNADVPWSTAYKFARWLREQMPDGRSTIDKKKRSYKHITDDYIAKATFALTTDKLDVAYQQIKMLALLHVEAVGFGKAGRNARRAQVRKLTGLCRGYVQAEQKFADDQKTESLAPSLYGVTGQ